jgi:ABC-type Fe3+-siderophore transport system permease subunit
MATSLVVTASVAVVIGLVGLIAGHVPRTMGQSGGRERVFPEKGTHGPQ